MAQRGARKRVHRVESFSLLPPAVRAAETVASRTASDENRSNDLTIHVGQPEVSARVAIDQARVVDPHEVKDRGVIVMDVHGVGHDLDAVLVRGSVGKASAYPSAGQERREGLGVVVAALVLPGRRSRACGRTRCRWR